MAKNLTVRAQALGGIWETIGVDRARGVWPENFSASSDPWGMTTCSFDLRRDSAAIWPDVSAFTPIEVEEDGRVVWEGRVKETPARDGTDGQVLNVQCEGWQYHLDDDMYERVYLHRNLADWVDARALADQDLTGFTALGKVTTGNTLQLGWAKDDVTAANYHVGVSLDLGQNNGAEAFALDVTRINGGPSVTVVVRGHSFPNAIAPAGLYEDGLVVSSMATITSTGYTLGGTFSNGPWQYITLLAYTPGAVTNTVDCTLIVSDARIYGDTAYTALGTSILKASTVIDDALDQATTLLSTDRSQIAATSFNLPSLAPDGPKTPREMWNGVNIYHGYKSKIGLNRTAVFEPQPSEPVVEVGDWSSMEFQDASSNSGEEIYNRVIATAGGGDGTDISISHTRTSTTDQLGTADVTIPNPSFASNTTGWTVGAGTLSRDTGDFDTSPASGAWATGVGTLSTSITGTFSPGTVYIVEFAVKSSNAADPLLVTWGSGTVRGTLNLDPTPTSWTTYRLAWSPTVAAASANLVFTRYHNSGTFKIDSVSVGVIRPTLVDRRGFVRTYQLQLASAMPTDGIAVKQIADVWLDQHKTTPFRGTLIVTGDQSVREITTGRFIPPSGLLAMTGELIRLADRVDPDTGAFGRDGVIAGVSYNHAANQATVTLDNSRSNLDALLARLGALSGG